MSASPLPVMSPLVVVLSLLHTALNLAGWIAILVVAIVRWTDTRRYLREGTILALAVLLLSLPGTALTILFMDVSSLLPPPLRQASTLIHAFAAAFGVVVMLLGTAHIILQAGVAGMATSERSPFPLLSRRGDRFGGWALAAGVGTASGFVSALLFHLMRVQAGSAFEIMLAMFPALRDYPASHLALAFTPAMLAAAVSEEVLYRGVLQAWLVRWLGGSGPRVVAAVAVTSLVWSLAHAPNATPMAPKLVQIFLLGLFLGWLSRRHSVEASIVAHVGLNLAALAGGLLWPT